MKRSKSLTGVAYHNANPSNGISLCIPHIFKNITAGRIKFEFIKAKFGFIERIDVVSIPNCNYNKAFVHFGAKKWNLSNPAARIALTSLQNGEGIPIIYDEPYFWTAYVSTLPRPTNQEMIERKKIANEVEKSRSVSGRRKQTIDKKKKKKEVSNEINKIKLDLNDPIQARIANQYSLR